MDFMDRVRGKALDRKVSEAARNKLTDTIAQNRAKVFAPVIAAFDQVKNLPIIGRDQKDATVSARIFKCHPTAYGYCGLAFSGTSVILKSVETQGGGAGIVREERSLQPKAMTEDEALDYLAGVVSLIAEIPE